MGRPKVLIVDDDDSICEFVSWGLSDLGYQVLSARDGQEALTVAGLSQPDAIVLDMLMPVMNGWEFARAYRETPGLHAPIVIMTAFLDPAKVAAEVGAQDFVSKPFDLITLGQILRKHIQE